LMKRVAVHDKAVTLCIVCAVCAYGHISPG
jgi:hypothetical protein